MDLAGSVVVVERLPDGRLLVESSDQPGVLVVTGTSEREPVAARMGYGRTRTPVRVRPAPTPARRRAPLGPSAVARAAEDALDHQRSSPERRARDLFVSLLDDDQRAQWQRHRSCWVDTPRGPVRLGRLHDLRFRPVESPNEERSLCVVPTGEPLPPSDVWTNLLLVLAADCDSFFAVANVRAVGLQPTPPHPPPRPGSRDERQPAR